MWEVFPALCFERECIGLIEFLSYIFVVFFLIKYLGLQFSLLDVFGSTDPIYLFNKGKYVTCFFS